MSANRYPTNLRWFFTGRPIYLWMILYLVVAFVGAITPMWVGYFRIDVVAGPASRAVGFEEAIPILLANLAVLALCSKLPSWEAAASRNLRLVSSISLLATIIICSLTPYLSPLTAYVPSSFNFPDNWRSKVLPFIPYLSANVAFCMGLTITCTALLGRWIGFVLGTLSVIGLWCAQAVPNLQVWIPLSADPRTGTPSLLVVGGSALISVGLGVWLWYRGGWRRPLLARWVPATLATES